MRLTAEEVAAIKATAREAFGESAVVRLFGSRIHDDLRGGDIDLHVEVADDALAWRAKAAFEARLFALIEEQRVDIVIHRREAPQRAIDVIAYQKGIVL